MSIYGPPTHYGPPSHYGVSGSIVKRILKCLWDSNARKAIFTPKKPVIERIEKRPQKAIVERIEKRGER